MIKSNNSFSKRVKEELVSRDYSNERLLAILSSFTRTNATLTLKNKKEYITLKIENSKIAKFMYSSIQKLFNVVPSISYLKKNNFQKNTCYLISIDIPNFLDKLHIDFLDNKIDYFFTKNQEQIGGYLAGSFLSCGSVNSPRSSNYHLELSFLNQKYAKSFITFVNKYKGAIFDFKIIKRRKKYVVYLKRGDQIVDFLVFIGATNSCLYFENTRVDRDYANNVNRIQNLDASNYLKTIKTAENDIKIIKKLIKKKGLTSLGGEKVLSLISARMENPEASLEDLAAIMSKELHYQISKSNVNHILRYLREEGKNL